MDFDQVVRYCPRCGSGDFAATSARSFLCGGCGFHFHINAATAVVGIVADHEGRVLLIRRARDPGKGKFSVPGGFVDADETAEAALAREMREEVGLELTSCTYLCSCPNAYAYKGVVFPVLDLAFVCTVRSLEVREDADEVGGYTLRRPAEVDLDGIAFPSVRRALELFRNQQAQHAG
uniref:Nudix hydrolase domain-containing protein n=1 Tax=uncultured Armatimonadetes bacterium TaxID=157466 RepID=A0A6J4HQE7_9BACT|nr:hypothetical protein AVDCRST_MAG63-923 [uncultured Armatimonadetes bacterium]